jgi:5-methyltetrahydropteroyltriglutamate--homocysteine methyltransferase
MSIPTEPIGSIPRPARLLETIAAFRAGSADESLLKDAYSEALRDTIERFEQTGSPVISDGEQTKPSFATYPLAGLTNLAPDGVTISFADGHVRQLPRLTSGPFRYGVHARSFIKEARRYSSLPMKQAVISPSALSLLYPGQGIPDYHHDAFLRDLITDPSQLKRPGIARITPKLNL